MNDLKRLVNDILGDQIRWFFVAVFALCEASHMAVRILNQGEEPAFEEELPHWTGIDLGRVKNCWMA